MTKLSKLGEQYAKPGKTRLSSLKDKDGCEHFHFTVGH